MGLKASLIKISSKIPNKYKIGIKALAGKLSYNQDGLATQHNCNFMNDPHFLKCYNLAVNHGLAVDSKIHWRAHVACWAALQAKNLKGDFIECGVNKGFLSRIICEYIDFNHMPKSKFYLLDTFEGLSDKYISKKEKAAGRTAGGYEPCYELVKKEFAPFKNVILIKGTIPDTLKNVKTRKIAYLSIDLNCVIPEIKAAEYFWNNLVSGGIILLDDYCFVGFEEQRKAFDEFAKNRGIQVLSLPTGQGLIIKP